MLRKGQKELVETYRKGYCGVPAIPGGGKTFALTQWAVEVLTEGANLPGKILIVTYMSSAANNFKQRISAELEKRGINSRDYYVSTIHSLCLQIIKDKPELVGINSEVEVIDTYQKNALIKDAFINWKRKDSNKEIYMYYLDEIYLQKHGYEKVAKFWDNDFCNLISTGISNFKTNEITPKEALEYTKGLSPVSILKIAAGIYQEYEKKLRRRGMIDFEDMLSKAKFILENDFIIRNIETFNVYDFIIFVNGEKQNLENEIKMYCGDEILIKITKNKILDNGKIILTGFDPNIIFDSDFNPESSLDEYKEKENIEIN
jgi:DNA helicase-2/ATP-dependent DNA helicase PcrA